MPSPTLLSSPSLPLSLPVTPDPVPRIKVFGLSLPSNHDPEKALPGPGPSTSRHSPSSSISSLGGGAAAKGLRRRRLFTQTAGVLGLFILLATWSGTIWLPMTGNWQKAPALDVQLDGDLDTLSAANNSASSSHNPHRPDTTPLTPLQAWGLNLRSDQLVAGLEPWPSNPPLNESEEPLSTLGHYADEVYDWGYLDVQNYTTQLEEFARIALPSSISTNVIQRISQILGQIPSSQPWDENKRIWQTAKDTSLDSSREVKTWRDGKAVEESWSWDLFTDDEATDYIKDHLDGSRLAMMWDALPVGILRSDTLRYLLMLLEGGIYSDTDTTLLKKPSEWGDDPTIWKFGDGWLDEPLKRRLAAGESADEVLGKPSVVVGIEADVGRRVDWAKWWPRPIQIAQWTMASAPFHPINLSAVLRILHRTAQAVDWAHEHDRTVKILNDQGRYKEAKAVRDATVMNEPSHGGPLGVMAWTGPGIWTDAVLSYLRVKYGMLWTDLRNLHKPLRVGDVVILPVTGFSPGVGNFGSQSPFHAQAMVEHGFKGSWKTDEHPR